MNLLPDHRKKALAHLYFIRVGVISAALLSGVLIVHTTLMVPSYLAYAQAAADREVELVGLGRELSGTEEKEVSNRVKTLNDNASYLAQAASGTAGSSAIRAIIAAPRPGIRITGFSFGRGKTVETSRMTIAGVGSTRESLRSYVAVLKALPYVSAVELPINAYAKETDIAFTIVLTGSFNL